jgi:hypothetical protein
MAKNSSFTLSDKDLSISKIKKELEDGKIWRATITWKSNNRTSVRFCVNKGIIKCSYEGSDFVQFTSIDCKLAKSIDFHRTQ